VSSPFRAMVDSLLIDDQATVLADGFDRVGSDPAIALRTWVRAGVRLDVFVEARLVDVSRRHVLSPVSGDSPARRTPHPLRGENKLRRL
jgi:hypothetical protein